jgi:cell division inhibitor SulA/protein ImuA
VNLQDILQRQDIWRGGCHATAAGRQLPTGHAALDAAIGGWPRGALIELLSDHSGIGEVSLLLPALAALSQQRCIVFVAPPHIPYAPALAAAGIPLPQVLWLRPASEADALWAMEQSLRSGVCGAVLGWPARPNPRSLRRLQLAAEAGDALAILYRPRRAADGASPAALRLELEPAANGLRVHTRKRRGGWNGAPLLITRTGLQ